MLNFEEFQQYVLDHTREVLPSELQDAHIELNQVNKNNGKILTAIMIRPEGASVIPAIYLEGFYESYIEGEGIDGIIKNIVDSAAKHQNENFGNIEQDYSNFEFVKDKIVMFLVNADKNKKMLEDTPHTMKEDLAVIYKVVLKTDDRKGMATIAVKQPHIERWGVSVEDIHALAIENSKRILPVTVKSINDVIMETAMGDGMLEDILPMMSESTPDDQQLYVISNSQNVNGASSIVYSNALQQLSERLGTDLYILPSSIHEVIAVSQNMGDPEGFSEMVREVNAGEVFIEDQLSDHVYKYSGSTQKLSLVDTMRDTPEMEKVSENTQAYETTGQEKTRSVRHR